MAVLTNADRRAIWRRYMSDASDLHEEYVLTKDELRSGVDAIDDWVNSNASSFNTAIPQPARGALSARQKAGLLTQVVKRRFEVT